MNRDSLSELWGSNSVNEEIIKGWNQSGVLFPIDSETSDMESYLISPVKVAGKEKNYELIGYINDVNREYAEVLVEQNINGTLDTAYVYGAAIDAGSDRLSLDHFDSTGYYLYDSRGSVTGIANEEGQIYQSYRYSVFGEITLGASQYENEYTYNGESYNPNIKSQYLRARYYYVVTADFLTEDSYLGDITKPLTLNRYNYCVGSLLNYVDPSGNMPYANGIKDFFDSIWNYIVWLFTFDEPELPELRSYPIEDTPSLTPTPAPPEIAESIANAVENSNNELCDIDEDRWKEVEEYIADHGISVINVPNREDQVEFLNSILLGAVREWMDMGVPWQVTMAQAAQETGWGKTAIIDIYSGENSNNLFGIKYSGSAENSQDYVLAWTSENISRSELETWKKEQEKWAMNGETIKIEKENDNGSIKIKVIQPFRAFESVNDSIMEHSKLLVNSSYYKDALQYNDDPYRYIEEIAEYYATDPNYAESISSIITKYLFWDGKK